MLFPNYTPPATPFFLHLQYFTQSYNVALLLKSIFCSHVALVNNIYLLSVSLPPSLIITPPFAVCRECGV